MRKAFGNCVFVVVLLCGAAWVHAKEAVVLVVKEAPVAVDGKEAAAFTIEQADGTHGITVEQSEGFHVVVRNALPVPTAIHWHGLILPNLQDGVPFVTQNPIPPGGEREYQFDLSQHGTFWMHSHYGLQEQPLTSAPLIIMNDEERAKAEQQIVVFLSDFSFERPGEILKGLQSAKPMEMKGSGQEGMEGMGGMGKEMVPSRVQIWDEETQRLAAAVEPRSPADIDVKYDALLANRRPAAAAEAIETRPGSTVLLRLIAGSSGTNFFVDTGALDAELLAVDGQPIDPVRGNFFQMAIAQRLDLRVSIPEEGGAFPILALGEGTRLQAGIVLVTPGEKAPPIAPMADTLAGGLDNTQELRLHSATPQPPKEVDRRLTSLLGGSMSPYVWTINGKPYPKSEPLDVKVGEQVEITIDNQTAMSHPMHLHGHDFTVTEINGQRLAGARRDTVLVPPGGVTKIQFDAKHVGVWAYHCHIIYHLVGGMFTVLKYEGADTEFWKPDEAATELDETIP